MFNIAILLGTFTGGGIERAVLTFLSSLDRSQFSPHIICYMKGGNLMSRFVALDVPIYEVPLHSWNMPYVIFQVTRYLKQERIRLIHSHAYHADVVARLAARHAKIPVVNTLHTNSTWKREPKSVLHRVRRYIDQFTARHYGIGFIGLTESIRQFHINCMHYPVKTWRIISNPLDLSRLNAGSGDRSAVRQALGISPDQIVVLAVGNLLPVKGHTYLLDAISLLNPESRKRVRVLICGEGRERGHLEKKIQALKLQDHVQLLGYREDVGALMAASDIFAMPSLSEGQSVAILEAMAVGLPLLVTSQGAHCDFLKNNQNAKLVEPANSKGLYVVLEDMIKFESIREHLGKSAFATLQKMPVMHSVDKQQAFYIELLDQWR